MHFTAEGGKPNPTWQEATEASGQPTAGAGGGGMVLPVPPRQRHS